MCLPSLSTWWLVLLLEGFSGQHAENPEPVEVDAHVLAMLVSELHFLLHLLDL